MPYIEAEIKRKERQQKIKNIENGNVEYLFEDEWYEITAFTTSPELNLDNSQWMKGNFIDYEIQFEPLVTQGIRIEGMSGGIEKDPANAYLGIQYYTAISELRIYSD